MFSRCGGSWGGGEEESASRDASSPNHRLSLLEPLQLSSPLTPPLPLFLCRQRTYEQEFAGALHGLDPELHEPLYDLYCQLLQGIGTFSLDEFESILREEAIVPRLNHLDQACEARGITELGSRASAGVAPLARPPDAVVRALRADVKRREKAALEATLAAAEGEAAAARQRLTEKSSEARAMAAGLRAGAAELQGVHLKGSVQWANRAPVFPAGAGVGPAVATNSVNGAPGTAVVGIGAR